jgi:hypothetical protein
MCSDQLPLLHNRCYCLPCVQVYYATVSAHADAKGILQLVQQVAPAAALLVHGEPDKMAFMSNKIQSSLGIKCFMPAIGEEVEVSSSGCTPVSTSAQLLRRLPMAVQQLLQSSEGGSSAAQGLSAGAAAAGWLQQGDVGQLVQAAMRLAGLDAAGSAAGNSSSSSSSKPQQQQQQQLPVSAAARAAQLAPWLELLAAAAQEVRKDADGAPQQQQPTQHNEQQQQEVGRQTDSRATRSQLQLQQQHELPAGLTIATLSQQLHQQLALESQSCILDGVLVVQHLPPKAPAEQQLVQSMRLLPAQDAAAVLGLAHHTVRLKSRLKLPAACWDAAALQQWLKAAGHRANAVQQQLQEPPVAQQSVDGAVGLQFVAAVLRTGLPASVAQHVQQEGSRVRIKSISIAVLDAQQYMLVCSWLLQDDALAQQCIYLVEAAGKAM